MIKSLYPCFQHWSELGAVYLVSDTHFKDLDRKYMGYHISNEDQFYLLKDTCHKNDTLIHLGDVGDLEYIKKLNCYKVLIMGNHDQSIEKFQKKYEIINLDKEFIDVKEIKEEEAYNSKCNEVIKKYKLDYISYEFHSPFIRGYKSNNLFDEVYSGPLWISQKLVLSHEPISVEDVNWGTPIAINIHGHEHNGIKHDDYHFNICQNIYGYVPLNLNQFIKSGKLKSISDIHRVTIDEATRVKENNERLKEIM